MRILSLCSLLAVLAATAGCLATKPLTISEFRGNCYQINASRMADCDNISVCEAYATTLETEVATFDTCMEACAQSHARLARTHALDGCGAVVDSGNDWCTRFCRSNYPQGKN